MSLESALEEERLEILKLLERPAGGRSSSSHPSGAFSTPSSPRQAYASLARTTSPARQVSSLIDAVSELPIPSSGRRGPTSGRSSPGLPSSPPPSANGIYRTSSGPSNPRLLGSHRPDRGLTPNAEYNFNMTPSSIGGAGNPNLRKQSGSRMGAMNRSRSPLAIGNGYRSTSPGAYALPVESARKILTEHGQLVDLDTAYAKLNDEALYSSGGILGTLPERKPAVDSEGQHVRASSGETVTSDGGLRLQKDLIDEETIVDSSDDDSSDDESPGTDDEEENRGRTGERRTRTQSLVDEENNNPTDSPDQEIKSMLDIGIDPGGSRKSAGKKTAKGPGHRKAMSLLAAAEEERKNVSSKYKVRSLLPSISVTPSVPGSPASSRRSGVHPSTSYDLASTASTPVSSDQEADDLDIRRAQHMEMIISPIISTPESQRVIRTIVRGEYESIHRNPTPDRERPRRPRKYLVATDLSAEAQYAMEWTIGTVLRDGDTLMAIYVADQVNVEDGGKPVSEASIEDALTTGELISQAHAAVQGTMTPPIHMGSLQHLPGTSSPLAVASRSSESGMERSRERTKAERERYIACDAITAVVQKLLKKTRLQVKVIVEVIHCKSPKHLLTEIIDLCEPTLVVLGSRGRSALKGVLLGSFSNYLVTKSSVPVMVARKKLKHTKKYAHTNVRLSNNLTSNTARILANAKVD